MEKTVTIPEGISVEKKGKIIEVTGPKGTIRKELSHRDVDMTIDEKSILIKPKNKRKKSNALVGTFASHMRNMFLGVEKGYQAELKAVYSHFPMKIKVDGNTFVVQNFMGERSTRSMEIPEGVKIDVKKDDVTISGINKEDVGQTAGRIERITKVTGFDRRVFQDGIYPIAKAHVVEEGGK